MPKEDLSIYNQVLLIALANKKHPDYNSQHRELARWFSSTFSTPYADAEKMQFETLLLHQLESQLEKISMKKVDNIFRKEFLTKKKDIQEEEAQKTGDEDWAQKIAAEAFKKKEKQLEKAESELIQEKEETPEGIVPPPDISRKF